MKQEFQEFSEIIEEWRYALLTMEQSKNAEITALQTELSLMKGRRAELIGEITRLEVANSELLEALTEAKLQIEYMESKAGVQYGTTAAILSRTEMILEKYAPK